jgi:hypothetical protein
MLFILTQDTYQDGGRGEKDGARLCMQVPYLMVSSALFSANREKVFSCDPFATTVVSWESRVT